MLDKEDIVNLSEVFVTKDDLEKFAQKDDLIQFKGEILTGQDKILQELKALRQEKVVGDKQEKRKTKVLEIHNNALKTKKILSDGEIGQIEKLHAF